MALHVARRCDVTRRPRRARCSTSSACSGLRRSDGPGAALALIASGTARASPRSSLRRGRAAARAVTLKEDFPAHELVAEPLRSGELHGVLARGVHVVELAARQTHQVVVRLLDVGVVARRTGTGVDLLHLAHGDELVE